MFRVYYQESKLNGSDDNNDSKKIYSRDGADL